MSVWVSMLRMALLGRLLLVQAVCFAIPNGFLGWLRGVETMFRVAWLSRPLSLGWLTARRSPSLTGVST